MRPDGQGHPGAPPGAGNGAVAEGLDSDDTWFPMSDDEPLGSVKPFLVQRDGQVSLHFHLGETQSSMCRDDPAALTLDYTRLMMGVLLLAPPPTAALMVGLGGGSLVKFILGQVPEAVLTVVELNPHVIALRDTFRIPPDGPRLQVVCADGADHVATTAVHHDLILVDGFDYGGQPEALCSADFYAACRDRLKPGGLLVVNLHADGDLEHRLLDRLALCFEGRLLSVPTPDGSNRIVFAGPGVPTGRALSAVRRRWAGLPPALREALAPVRPALMTALLGR